MLHGVGDLFPHRKTLLRVGEILEGLDHDKHVVDAEAEQEEGDDGRHVGVEEPEVEAEPERAEHRQADHRHPHQGEKHLHRNLL